MIGSSCVAFASADSIERRHWKRFMRETRGAGYVEYFVLIGVIALAGSAIFEHFRGALTDVATREGELIGLDITGTTGGGSIPPPLSSPPAPAPAASPARPLNDSNGLMMGNALADKKRYDAILNDEGGGTIQALLEVLPGGTPPTRTELVEADAIVRKYEAELQQHKGDPNFDARGITLVMAKELEPLARAHRDDATWWYYMVKTGSVFDLKNRENAANDYPWQGPWDFGPYAAGKDNKDVAGNYLFGYLGAETFGTGPLGQAFLKGSAGFAQLQSDGLKDPGSLVKWAHSLKSGEWGDNPGDAGKIGLGISDYALLHTNLASFAARTWYQAQHPFEPDASIELDASNRDLQLSAAIAAKDGKKAADAAGEKVHDLLQEYVVNPVTYPFGYVLH